MFTPAPTKFPHDSEYINVLKDIRDNGVDTQMRNMVCRKVHGRVARYDMKHGFPLMMHKKVFDSFSKEITWMLRGETNINTLGCKIWDKWADALGELGPVYGEQMRKQVFFKLAFNISDLSKYKAAGYVNFGVAELTKEDIIEEIGEERFEALLDSGDLESHYVETEDGEHYEEYTVQLMRKKVDQLQRAIKELHEVNRTGIANRRTLISLWNNADYEMQALPPCHTIFHFLQLPMTEQERYEWACNHLYVESQNQLDRMYSNHDDPAIAIRDHVESEIHHMRYNPDCDGDTSAEYSISQVLDLLKAPTFKLDLVLFMRSNDYGAGAPFNVGGYAAVLLKMAQEVNMVPNELIHFASDAHIYADQEEAIETIIDQYNTMYKTESWSYPSIELNSKSILEMTHEDFIIKNYKHMPYVYIPVTE